jgi:hypothetical protein
MRHYNLDRRTNFFVQNSLWIGYQAWQGYLNLDRGVLVISSSIDLMDDSDRHSRDVSEPSLNFRYIPQQQLPIYLQEWLVPNDSIDPILAAVADYQPAAELVFAIESGSNLDIGWCQNLQVLPPACHQQIDRRLSEFQLTT